MIEEIIKEIASKPGGKRLIQIARGKSPRDYERIHTLLKYAAEIDAILKAAKVTLKK